MTSGSKTNCRNIIRPPHNAVYKTLSRNHIITRLFCNARQIDRLTAQKRFNFTFAGQHCITATTCAVQLTESCLFLPQTPLEYSKVKYCHQH
jgi:hypothetical protein